MICRQFWQLEPESCPNHVLTDRCYSKSGFTAGQKSMDLCPCFIPVLASQEFPWCPLGQALWDRGARSALISRCQIRSACALDSCHWADQVSADPVLRFGLPEPTLVTQCRTGSQRSPFTFLLHSDSPPHIAIAENNKTITAWISLPKWLVFQGTVRRERDCENLKKRAS